MGFSCWCFTSCICIYVDCVFSVVVFKYALSVVGFCLSSLSSSLLSRSWSWSRSWSSVSFVVLIWTVYARFMGCSRPYCTFKVSEFKGCSFRVSGGSSPFFDSGRGMIEEAQGWQGLFFNLKFGH